MSTYRMTTLNPSFIKSIDSTTFTRLLANMGMIPNERNRLQTKSFDTFCCLLEIFHSTKNLQKLLRNLNNTFGSTSNATYRSFFLITITRCLCVFHWFMNILISGMNQVLEIDLIDIPLSNF